VFTSTKEIGDKEIINIQLYPNPASDRLYLNHTEAGSSGFDVSIYNVLGEAVLMRRSLNSSEHLNVQSLTSGIYFVELSSKGEVKGTEKLYVNRD